jgi:hypothetical protein
MSHIFQKLVIWIILIVQSVIAYVVVSSTFSYPQLWVQSMIDKCGETTLRVNSLF